MKRPLRQIYNGGYDITPTPDQKQRELEEHYPPLGGKEEDRCLFLFYSSGRVYTRVRVGGVWGWCIAC